MIALIHEAHAGVISEAPSVLELLLNFAQFILSIVSIIAVIAIVFSGIMYITSAGNTRRVGFAKSALVGSIVGLVISLASLSIVSIIVSQISA